MKKRKAGKIILIAAAAVLVVLLLLGVGTAAMFKEEIAIIRTIQKLDAENHVYIMEFKDGYHLDKERGYQRRR